MPIFLLEENSCRFPPLELAEPEGLLAVGGDLSVKRLLSAYRQGIFPWYSEGDPILWWSPQPRCVIRPEKLHVPASLKKVLKSGRFSFTVDQAFERVIKHCSQIERPGQPGTWLVPDMVEAYIKLHQAGHAHSVEAWEGGELAGGLYGVSIGKAFFGESMFFLRPNASKAAFVWLADNLVRNGYKMIDCQQETEHMMRFGAELLPLEAFQKLLADSVESVGEWPGFEDPNSKIR